MATQFSHTLISIQAVAIVSSSTKMSEYIYLLIRTILTISKILTWFKYLYNVLNSFVLAFNEGAFVLRQLTVSYWHLMKVHLY